MEHLEEKLRGEMTAMEERLNKRLDTSIKGIEMMLEPLVETYKTATKLGRWVTAFLVLVSIILGIILSFQKIFHR